MDDFSSLKSIIKNHQDQHGKRKAFPIDVWNRISVLAERFPTAKIANELEISPANLLRQLKNRQKMQVKASSDISLIEVPSQVFNKKQMTIELPHNIVIRIDI